MTYKKIKKATFIDRPNRFIAHVRMDDGTVETVHVKNTGRCKELLVPGRTVILSEGDNPARKTKYDLIEVYKPGVGLINMDSQAPNTVAADWLRRHYPTASIRREVTYGSSRFDICMELDGEISYIEVKGVTLERDGVASFPDAPTERGVKHIRELTECKRSGYGAKILFVVQMKGIKYLTPNDETHPEFGAALREAVLNGVEVLAVDCTVGEGTVTADAPVEVKLY